MERTVRSRTLGPDLCAVFERTVGVAVDAVDCPELMGDVLAVTVGVSVTTLVDVDPVADCADVAAIEDELG